MSNSECMDRLRAMPDAQLQDFAKEACMDLEKVASNSPNSEWHDACFAAVILAYQEMNRRGLKAAPAPASR